jgi:hypothetical protein
MRFFVDYIMTMCLHYTASNGKLMGNELERIWKGTIQAFACRNCEIHENPRQDRLELSTSGKRILNVTATPPARCEMWLIFVTE